ncbi:hypothetical protein AB0J80_09585 [Actinoplanes sp. NPDC049548]|uniref:hypothetical protein n=1 Tax=Actinoplanes sp. NPDC049548 TaxID=3155152 RepID=UPI00342B1FD3
MSHRRVSVSAAVLVLAGIVIAAPAVPVTASSWLGTAALAVMMWPLLVDAKRPSAVAVGHLGLIASCFALGVHDEHRTVWWTMLATFTALPLAWIFRRSGRPAKGIAGLVLAGVTFGVFAWSTEQLGDAPLSTMPDFLLFSTAAGVVLIFQAVRGPKPLPELATTEPEPPAKPVLPPWARDVTAPPA